MIYMTPYIVTSAMTGTHNVMGLIMHDEIKWPVLFLSWMVLGLLKLSMAHSAISRLPGMFLTMDFL